MVELGSTGASNRRRRTPTRGRSRAAGRRDPEGTRRMLAQYGQEHLLRFWEDLSEPQQSALLKQIEAVRHEELAELIKQHVLRKPEAQVPQEIQPPAIIPARSRTQAETRLHEDARRRGVELIAAGKVAAFVVAGGLGSRLGYEGPKGCMEATPVTRKPLFRVLAEQILAAGRHAGPPVPWYVMTSPNNDVATRAFFRQHGYFGLRKQDVFFLVQGTMPQIGFDGKVLLAGKGELAVGPDGHGGSLSGLRDSGALADMADRGVELISYFQVDNPLVRCVDPLFLGLHDLQGAEMSAKCLPKREPLEKLGNFCIVDGKVVVIEYSDLPEELAYATTEDGRLRFSAGSIAIHVLSRSFVERLTADGKAPLPFHRADKIVPCVNEAGEVVRPTEPNGVKLEMFVFDAMPLARKCVILETERNEEFSPIKNASGPDSLATSLRAQVRRAARWLERAGITVPRDADGQVAAAIEISPLFAQDARELSEKVDRNLKINAGDSVFLGD